MAKRRKKTSRRRTSRRRMGAMGGANIQAALGIIAGAVAGRLVAKKLLPNVDERIKNAGVVVLGAAVFPRLIKGELGKAIGNGMIAAGGAGLVGSFIPALGAMDDTMMFPVTVGEVPDNLSVIAGDDQVLAGDDLSVMAGMDTEDYEDNY
jgi:hypothetical protein